MHFGKIMVAAWNVKVQNTFDTRMRRNASIEKLEKKKSKIIESALIIYLLLSLSKHGIVD